MCLAVSVGMEGFRLNAAEESHHDKAGHRSSFCLCMELLDF